MWKTPQWLGGAQRFRTKKKEFPFENMGGFADRQVPDGSGCHGVSEFHSLTG